MGPHERPSRPGGQSKEQVPLRNVGRIPDLLGKQTALAREPLQSQRQPVGDVLSPGASS
jgi:hypothetical protein